MSKFGYHQSFLQQHENKIVANNFSFLALNENGNCTKQMMLSGLQVMTRSEFELLQDWIISVAAVLRKQFKGITWKKLSSSLQQNSCQGLRDIFCYYAHTTLKLLRSSCFVFKYLANSIPWILMLEMWYFNNTYSLSTDVIIVIHSMIFSMITEWPASFVILIITLLCSFAKLNKRPG